MTNKQTVLFIDGENFLYGVASILKNAHKIQHRSQIQRYPIDQLVKTALGQFEVDEINFYAGKIHIPINIPDLVDKSKAIAESQRHLKRSLIDQKINFILSGHVRLQDTKMNAQGKIQGVFKEKGTDVRVAVDMMSMACDDKIATALLLSSDSDMQSAIKEVQRRGVKVVYVGFENQINAGLSITCDKTMVLTKNEIVQAWESVSQRPDA